MSKALAPLLAGLLLLAACASLGLRQDCLERKQKADRVASLAQELQAGLTAQEVRTLVGEPDEIIAARGLGDFEPGNIIWVCPPRSPRCLSWTGGC